MNTRPTPIRPPHRRPAGPLLLAVAAAAALAACGGGGSAEDDNISTDVAQSTGATAGVVPDEASAATSAALSVSREVVSIGQAGLTIACAGGGTASYSVSGPVSGNLGNGQFDAGEHYELAFANCVGAAGNKIDGSYTLDVVTASATGFDVNTATNNVVVTLPRSTITINGSSHWVQSVASNVNGSTTTTTHWTTTTDHVVTVLRNGRTRSHALSNVDLTRGFTTANGAVTGSTLDGHATLTSVWPNGRYSITFNVDSTVSYDGSGNPTQGAWTITLPNNIVNFSIVGSRATVKLDHGANGSWDRIFSWTVLELVASGG